MKGVERTNINWFPLNVEKKIYFVIFPPSLFMNIYIHAWIINEHLRSEMSSSSINNCQIIND